MMQNIEKQTQGSVESNGLSNLDETKETSIISHQDWEITKEKTKEEQKMEEFQKKLKFRNVEFKYPTEECIQQMEEVLRNWWSIQDACWIVWISYRRLKNRTNPYRSYSKYYTKKQQNELIRRLRAAKAFFWVNSKYALMQLSKTNIKAALEIYKIAKEQHEEEDERFKKKDTFEEELYWKYDYDMEEEEDNYFY